MDATGAIAVMGTAFGLGMLVIGAGIAHSRHSHVRVYASGKVFALVGVMSLTAVLTALWVRAAFPVESNAAAPTPKTSLSQPYGGAVANDCPVN